MSCYCRSIRSQVPMQKNVSSYVLVEAGLKPASTEIWHLYFTEAYNYRCPDKYLFRPHEECHPEPFTVL